MEQDDHGHATLLVHGEPDIIALVATAVTLLLANEAEDISLIDPEELSEVRIVEEGEPGLAESA